jgi:large subunit ribosomal protein L6
MSRIGKLPIRIPKGVQVQIEREQVVVSGRLGKLVQRYEPEIIKLDLVDGLLKVNRLSDTKIARERHGLYRSLIANMVRGVEQAYEKRLQLVGLGYRARLEGQTIVLEIGFTNPMKYAIPQGLTAEVLEQTEIVLRGPDKQQVGEAAAEIRALRKPEPYQGKGIRYKGEQIRHKEGKLAGGAAAATKEGGA